MAEEPKPTSPGAPPAPPPGAREDFRYIVRFANTDLDGRRSVVYALQKVKGVGARVAEAVADLAKVPRWERIGNLPEEKTGEIEKILASLADHVPGWMLNRQVDLETGDDLHVFGADVDLRWRDDVNRMKMIRSYRGVRHVAGLRVRGQRTHGNSRTGLAVGVTKKTAIAAALAKEKEEGKRKKE